MLCFLANNTINYVILVWFHQYDLNDDHHNIVSFARVTLRRLCSALTPHLGYVQPVSSQDVPQKPSGQLQVFVITHCPPLRQGELQTPIRKLPGGEPRALCLGLGTKWVFAAMKGSNRGLLLEIIPGVTLVSNSGLGVGITGLTVITGLLASGAASNKQMPFYLLSLRRLTIIQCLYLMFYIHSTRKLLCIRTFFLI